jgi:formiminotetrahydrofolate cyclodeaminase
VSTFLERPLGEFLDELAAGGSLPGGGAAAAVTTAMAAGLLAMAARASDESWSDARAVAAQAESLRDRAEPLAQADAEAYTEVIRLLGERDDEDRERRDVRLGAALSRAAALPLRIAEAACDVAELGVLVANRCEPRLRPDAAAAVILADAAAQIGAHLVRVNLATQANDERLAQAEDLVELTQRAVRRVLGKD